MKVAVTFGRDSRREPYLAALRQAGLEPVQISPEDGVKSLDGVGGLLLSGGTDVDPRQYGQTRRAETQKPDPRRDAMEQQFLKQALRADLPVLAICRGMQLFNVTMGGTLEQHLDPAAGHRVVPKVPEDASKPAHAIEVKPGTQLAEIVGEGPVQVNSRHHQALDKLGNGLTVSARAADGVVEAFEKPDQKFAVAVQWHPEDCVKSDSKQRKLFEAFAEAVRG
ncbi:MAG: gamma-glutamyl-gamma-aminobutyrate hydrolase family protein [Bryobacterales bacterium]|nr:gamma-glutamyl-gamma-aminobutyrate hydrolase family protein [Bryobacterales bacterium]